MERFDLRFRQVHLDFHTSEKIAGIGSRFNPETFAATLEEARVNSITCFGRCHHGWMYFDSQAFPERRHPHLERNLLKEQIDACHARDIRVPIYTTVQWDQFTAERHPEWLVIDETGRQIGTPPYEAGFYRRLCVNTPYFDFLKAHIQEMLETLPVDGLFLDIVHPMECSCRFCRVGMEEKGMEPSDATDRKAYGVEVINRFKRELSAFVRELNPSCSIFYNSGHVGPSLRPVADTYTHFELESLPSGGWGYMHFPVSVRYARTLGHACLGMTGKFHTSWGDFHSFKNPEALQFECFQMLAQGAQCSVGDQLHPEGEICGATYGLIGSVYKEVEKKEAWCKDAVPVVDIGVLTPEEFTGERVPLAAAGAVRMLQEGAHQFDLVDTMADLSKYRLIILPDQIQVSVVFAKKLEAYLGGRGALIASHRSGLTEAGNGFSLEAFGVKLKGEAPFSPDFLMPEDDLGRGLARTEHVMYMRGLEVEALPGSEVLVDAVAPYFNRTYQHFCSHRHTPSAGQVGYPGVVQNGRAIYFAHPIFSQYGQNAPRWCKQLMLNAIEGLLPDPLVQLEGPSTLLATLNSQAAKDRFVIHLLHYVPERRGLDFDVIEDVIPVYDVGISVRTSRRVSSVICVPTGDALEFEENSGRVLFRLPKLDGHQMVEIQFG
ncbi:MAG: beta-galactosidase trimerization domain-containing protein [bacterium]|nr:beta-galactosidase trimerization domain-containing protein [bacterium]